MHLIITDAWLARKEALHLSGAKLLMAVVALACALVVTALGLYHWVFLEGLRQGWPVVGPAVRLLVKDQVATQSGQLQGNLDAMARQLGQMQARLLQLESLGERVASLAGVEPPSPAMGSGAASPQGGPLIAAEPLTPRQLTTLLDQVLGRTSSQVDWFTAVEARLFDQKIRESMLPTEPPVPGVAPGSPFGWRTDPFTGQPALHSGLDFPTDVGAPIVAAAAGVVLSAEFHPAYGLVVELDHGNRLATRYAHASKVHVKKGDLVKRGQKIAEVGSTGRSTGPHLHFEVLVSGVPQDPQKFLDAGLTLARAETPPRPVATGPRR